MLTHNWSQYNNLTKDIIILIHNTRFKPNEERLITNYTTGSNLIGASNRGKILDNLFDQTIDFEAAYNDLNKSFFLDEGKQISIKRNLSILKHRIANLFLTLDLDLQTLWENRDDLLKTFNSDDWEIFVDRYANIAWSERFITAEYYMKELFSESTYNGNEINKIINELRNEKLSALSFFTLINKSRDPKKKKDKKKIYEIIQSMYPSNPVHEWLNKLDEKLTDLIKNK